LDFAPHKALSAGASPADYARNTALNYIKKAKDALNILRDSEAKEILKGLADYSTKREK